MKTARLLITLALAVATASFAFGQTKISWANVSSPASISSIGSLTPAADKLPYYTGASTAALADFTPFARTVLDDTTAAGVRTTLGFGTAALGTITYGSAADTLAVLAGNTSTTMSVLTQTGNGSVSAAPVWTTTTGTGSIVRATSPTLVTPTLGAATATSVATTTGSASTSWYVGKTTGTSYASLPSALQVGGTSAAASISIARDSNDTASPRLVFAKSRSASIGGLTAVVNGDTLADIYFIGVDGVGVSTLGASITALVDGTVSSGVVPGKLTFSTANSAGALSNRMSIDNTGQVLVLSSAAASSKDTGAFVVDTGGIGVEGTGWFGGGLVATGASGTSRGFFSYTGTTARWGVYASSSAESTGNAGSNFVITSYDDAGSAIDNIMTVTRAAGGIMALSRPITSSATTASTTKDSGSLVLEGGLGVELAGYFGGAISSASTISSSGNRAVTLNGGVGQVSVSGSSGGWDSVGYRFLGSAGTLAGAFYGEGSTDSMTSVYYGTGTTPSSNKVTVWTPTAFTIPITTASSATTNGALVVGGGVGIAGAVNIGGSTTITGVTAIGTTINSGIALNLTPSALTGTTQYGIRSYPTGSSAATNFIRSGSFGYQTAAASFTAASAFGVFVETPTIGAGSAVTTGTGVHVTNQGATGITNAYGIDIAAQSGASSVNVGLRNAGQTLLTNATSTSSTTTGALVVSGGIGVGGGIVTGATITNAGTYTSTSSAEAGSVVFTAVSGYTNFRQIFSMQNASNGDALTMGQTGASYAGSVASLTNNQAFIYSPGKFTIARGIGATSAMHFDTGGLTIAPTTASTTTGTGALIVAGGVGVGGAAFLGGNVNTAGQFISSINGIGFVQNAAAGNDATIRLGQATITNWDIKNNATSGSLTISGLAFTATANNTGFTVNKPLITAEHFEGVEQASDPAAPAANGFKLYAKDNGSGKTLLVVRFATGAVQTVATEP